MLNSLTLRNFKMYESDTINFKDGITAAIGENGVGKSSIFEAIEFALYGKVKRKGKFLGTKDTPSLDKLIEIGKKSCSVELNFNSPVTKRNYTVVRKISEKSSTAELFEGKKLIAKSISGVNKMNESLLGLNQDAFSAISYVRQGEISELTNVRAGEREDIINSILNLEIYDDAAKKANEEKLELERKIKELDAQISKLNQHKEQDESNLNAVNKELEKLKPKFEKSSVAEKKLKGEQKIHNELKQLEIKIDGLEDTIKNMKDNAKEKVEGYKTKIELEREKQKFQTPAFTIYGAIATIILSAIAFFIIPLLSVLILIIGLIIIGYMYHKTKSDYRPDTKKISTLQKASVDMQKKDNDVIKEKEKLLEKWEEKYDELNEKISSEDIEVEVESAGKEKERSLSEFKEIQGTVNQLRKKIKEYIDDINGLHADKNKYMRTVDDLDIVMNSILKAIPRWVRLRLIALVREETKNVFTKMFGAKYKDIRITNDYSVEVLSSYGTYFPVSMISGGEDTAANIALRLGISRALHKVYSDVRGSTGSPGLLIMDEPTTHLDRKRRELLIDVIKAVKDLPQVIISTNVEEIENAAKNKLYIERESPLKPVRITSIKDNMGINL